MSNPKPAHAANTSDPGAPSEAMAGQAGLVYVGDDTPGYGRRRAGRGFSYLDPQGRVVKSADLRQRFAALAIPPAWTNVWICADPDGHIQVTGRDEQGRKQYIYHPRWEALRNRTKFDRMVHFAEALPTIRAQVEQDLRQHDPTFEKIVALVVRLIDDSLMRVGNAEYAAQHESYGLTTLLNEHVTLTRSRLIFDFVGKSGKEQHILLKDRRLARLVRQCQELPGQQLFQYRNAAGELQAVRSSEVNDYLRGVSGEDFTAKDFRTWGGTVAAAKTLCEIGPRTEPKEVQVALRQAVKAAAERLGNTVTVCRQYYIHPAILAEYEAGRLCARLEQSMSSYQAQPLGLDAVETAVHALLKTAPKTGSAPQTKASKRR